MSFQVFEDDKENASPLRIGGTTPLGNSKIHSTKDQYATFEQQIANYTGDNIFPLCQKYLALIKENEGPKSKLFKETLFRLLRKIADAPTYLSAVRSNLDYVKYWLIHIEAYDAEEQSDFFQYMNSKSIGLTQPLFYIAWATCLEHLDNFENADKLYQAGLRRVKDTKLIERHYADFKDRCEMANEERRRQQEKKRQLNSKRREKKKMKLHQMPTVRDNIPALSSSDTPIVEYNKNAVYTVSGEFQFEELRAMLPKYQIVPKPISIVEPQAFQTGSDDEDMELDCDMDDEDIIHSKMDDEDIINQSEVIISDSTRPNVKMEIEPARPTLVERRSEQQQLYQQQQQQRQQQQQQQQQQPNAHRRTSDVTLFTKSAFSEINSMFCGNLDTTEEIFFEKKKHQRQHKASPPHQSLFEIHEDNTQDIQAAQAALTVQKDKLSSQNALDKENQIVKPLQQIRSRRSSMIPQNRPNRDAENRAPQSNLEKQIRRLSQAPRRASLMRRLSLVQQPPQSMRPPRLSLLPDDDEYYDEDPNASLYLDTDTIALNPDLSETINFNDVMNTSDAMSGTISALKQILLAHVRQSNDKQIVDPYDSSIMDQLQKHIIVPYSENDRRFNDERGKSSPTIPDTLPNRTDSENRISIHLGSREYIIHNVLGEGAYAKVFSASYLQADGQLSDTMAIKVQSPSCPWEFYICDQLQRRTDVLFSEKFIKPWRMFLYEQKSFLVLPYGGYGTLLDQINKRRTVNKVMEESMVMYYAIELLKVVRELHSCNIIHGDIKPDNCLIMNEDTGSFEDWRREGGPVWNSKGIVLIDFGRSIDMSLYPSGTKFSGDHGASSFKCIEMQTGMPWTYQADLYGICGVVHTMLFNKYMDVEQKTDRATGKTVWMIKEKFKRYHCRLWAEFFEAMLNIPSCEALPNLKHYQEKFEDYIIEKKWERIIRGHWAKQFVSQ